MCQNTDQERTLQKLLGRSSLSGQLLFLLSYGSLVDDDRTLFFLEKSSP